VRSSFEARGAYTLTSLNDELPTYRFPKHFSVVGRLDQNAHTVSEYGLQFASLRPLYIAAGPDGAIWFGAFEGDTIDLNSRMYASVNWSDRSRSREAASRRCVFVPFAGKDAIDEPVEIFMDETHRETQRECDGWPAKAVTGRRPGSFARTMKWKGTCELSTLLP
jgi:hypothetical protein